MGPVELVWEDGLIVGSMILLNGTLPVPHSMSLVCAFLLAHLGGLTLSLWATRVRAIGYLTAFGLGLAVWLWRWPAACLAVSTLVYMIGYEGLYRGLSQFPWKPRRMPTISDLSKEMSDFRVAAEPCGWPFDRMMREIRFDGISRIDAAISCTLLSWWLFVLSSFVRLSEIRERAAVALFFIVWMMVPITRVAVYLQGYQSPISFWGRIWTGRWIIPGYDRVFVPPILILAGGPLSVYCLQAGGVPLDIAAIIGIGIVMLLSLTLPPRLRRWRLTGKHRIVPSTVSSQSKANPFVQVG